MSDKVGKGVTRIIQSFQLMRSYPTIPLLIVLALVVVSVAGPLIAPYGPADGSLSIKLLPPSWIEGGRPEHFLGTDTLGRDVLSRIIYGAPISLTLSLIAIFFSGTVGTLVGLISGYYGGWVDTVLMRLTDVTLSVPVILMAVLLAVVLGPSFQNVVLIVVMLLWPRYARQIRGETLSIKEQDFVALAKVSGHGSLAIIRRHILPNVVPTLLVLTTLQVGYVIIMESSLSFLGVGVPPPTPAWGLMVAEGRGLISTAWWLPIFPGVAILLTVFACNMIGDWLRDRLDPKLRQV